MVWNILKFSKKLKKKDYEKELEELQTKINQVEASIKKNQVREASFASNWLLYSFLFYLISSSLAYYFSPLEWGPLRFLPLILGPIIIYLGKRFLKTYFQRKTKSLETFLDFLKTELKSKVEEIKNNEPYNKAKQLLERYEPQKKEEVINPNVAGQPIRNRAHPGAPMTKQGFPQGGMPGSPNFPQGMPPPVVRPGVGPSSPQRPENPFIPQQQQQQQQFPPGFAPSFQQRPPPNPIPAPNPNWIDKLVDYAVGDSQAANMNNMLERVQRENINLRNTVVELQRQLVLLKAQQQGTPLPEAQEKDGAGAEGSEHSPEEPPTQGEETHESSNDQPPEQPKEEDSGSQQEEGSTQNKKEE